METICKVVGHVPPPKLYVYMCICIQVHMYVYVCMHDRCVLEWLENKYYDKNHDDGGEL